MQELIFGDDDRYNEEINVERTDISFPRDEENLMIFSKGRHGQFKGDWISVGSAGMPIHFVIVQDGVKNQRQVYCASVNNRLTYRIVAMGKCSLKDARVWCTDNASKLVDVFESGGIFQVDTIMASFFVPAEFVPSSDSPELIELQRTVKELEKKLAAAMAKQKGK